MWQSFAKGLPLFRHHKETEVCSLRASIWRVVLMTPPCYPPGLGPQVCGKEILQILQVPTEECHDKLEFDSGLLKPGSFQLHSVGKKWREGGSAQAKLMPITNKPPHVCGISIHMLNALGNRECQSHLCKD